jgi:hypothetical protein
VRSVAADADAALHARALQHSFILSPAHLCCPPAVFLWALSFGFLLVFVHLVLFSLLDRDRSCVTRAPQWDTCPCGAVAYPLI